MAESPDIRSPRGDQIARRVDIGDPGSVSPLVLLLSPCRSGSTALMRVFAAASVESHMQPLKIILRWLLEGGECGWRVPQRPDRTVLVKETLGPYAQAEAIFDPLTVLLEAGYPAAKLQLIVMGRDLLQTWVSWREWFGTRTSEELFGLSVRTLDRLRRQALRRGIPTTTLVYESLRDHPPQRVARRLFERLGLPFPPGCVRGWRGQPEFATRGSGIHWLPMPAPYVVPHIHDQIRAADDLAYRPRPTDALPSPGEVKRRFRKAGLQRIYRSWERASVEDLGRQVYEAQAVSR